MLKFPHHHARHKHQIVSNSCHRIVLVQNLKTNFTLSKNIFSIKPVANKICIIIPHLFFAQTHCKIFSPTTIIVEAIHTKWSLGWGGFNSGIEFKFYFLKGIIQFQRSAHLPNGYFRLLNVFASLKLLLLLHWIVLYHE